ncbi:hypothetical protein MMC09_007119 [Bachmanniomyces sp. S44760]|nr:hypothetical protein [Bachmanniomyces sp. S44760]
MDQLVTIIGAALVAVGVVNGLGRHEYYLSPAQRRKFQALGWADWVQTYICLMFTKTAICLFLLRIVEVGKVRTCIKATMYFVVLFSAMSVFLFIGACRPLRAYWDVGVDGVCLSDVQIKNVVLAQGILSIIADLVCATFPLIFLRKLQVNLHTKVGLCLLMSLGVITAICCTVRTVLTGALLDKDLSWAIRANICWRFPEVNIGITCANAPILRPLYLYSQNRLASQRTPSTSISKERSWSQAPKQSGSTKLLDHPTAAKIHSPAWDDTTTFVSGSVASMEMGIPSHKVEDSHV